MIFRHIVGTGGCFLRAVKHNRSRKRCHYSRYCETRMLEYATRGRRSIYSTVWQTSRIFPTSLWNNRVPFTRARLCASRLKVGPNFLRPRARTLPIILSLAPVIQRAYVQIQIERLKQVCNYLAPFILGFRNPDIAILVSSSLEIASLLLSSQGSFKSSSMCVSLYSCNPFFRDYNFAGRY